MDRWYIDNKLYVVSVIRFGGAAIYNDTFVYNIYDDI